MNSQQFAVQRHWTEVDIETEMDDRLVAMDDELGQNAIGIDPFTLFMLEALGYVVDLDTGQVKNE